MKDGAVWRVRKKRRGVAEAQPEMVADLGFEMDPNYIYFVDRDGDISRVVASEIDSFDQDLDGEGEEDGDGLIGALDAKPELERQVSEAETVLARVLPARKDQVLVLKRLLESARIAEEVAPSAWAVTLFSDGFRLNVGQVEVLVLGDHILRVNLFTELGVPPVVGLRFEATTYRSMPEPQCAFVGTIAEYAEVESTITAAHESFVRRAASTRSGEARSGSPFRRSHNEGLLQLARSILGGTETCPTLPEELPPGTYREGQGVQVTVNRYEREPLARAACLKHFGPICQICRVDLSTFYGPLAVGLIHVHHLRPLSQIEGEYVVRPEQDLIPVCPNCHAVVHRRDPPLTPDELRYMVAQVRASKV